MKGGCGVFQCENKLNVSSFGPISKQFVEKYNQRPLRPPLSKAYIAYIKIFLMLHITGEVSDLEKRVCFKRPKLNQLRKSISYR